MENYDSLSGLGLKNLRKVYEKKTQDDYLRKTAWRVDAEKPHPWANFVSTKPSQHNKRNFLYLVHGVRAYEHVEPRNIFDKFHAKPAVSMSLISHEFSDPFYKVGFILEVPPTNIVAARPHDIAGAILNENTSEFEFRMAIQEANDIWGVFSPEELLAFSKVENRHNEIYAITGFRYAQNPKITVSGVFLGSSVYNIEVSNLARNLESKLSVPLVKI